MKDEHLILAVLGLLLLGGGGVAVYEMTRGIRNRNPGNIRKSSNAWVGKIAGSDPAFETFDTMENGIRAAAVLFRNYQSKYGAESIIDLIGRWAPNNENNTRAYAKFVAENVFPGEPWMDAVVKPINLRSSILFPFLRAVFRMENGPIADTVISDQQIATGIARAN